MMQSVSEKLQCYHCGENCRNTEIEIEGKIFCCEGCKMVYGILNSHGMCAYYEMNSRPGVNRRQPLRPDKFAFLDDEKIKLQLTSFQNAGQTHVIFYLPQVHCSSCLWVVENLHLLNPGVINVKLNFTRKEAAIVFDHNTVSIRKVAELLASIGYEPYISLNDLKNKRPLVNQKMILQLGVAGFCFANIMLLSFPEYLGIEKADALLMPAFRYLGLLLSLPVVFYSAQPFFRTAIGGLRQKYLNMDAGIVIAIIVTFSRSLYEVLTATGSGYFDSLSGIVFFMLIGRVLQDRTYQQLSFDRDYTSYFPIAITVLKDEQEIPTALPDIKAGDTILIHHQELVPADGILTRGKAWIDYSFVTGEALPVAKEMGEIVYAGGRQTGGNMELLVIKEVSQSYLASLWEKDAFKQSAKEEKKSFVQQLARYFTAIVFTIATCAAIYWWMHDSSKIWYAVTAVLIVACPCALLLSNTFTNGNILRILGSNGLYLRNAHVIEDIAAATDIVFDKTGTLTSSEYNISYYGSNLSSQQRRAIASVAAQSTHPLSAALSKYLLEDATLDVQQFSETAGKGIKGVTAGQLVSLGSRSFITGQPAVQVQATRVYVSINNVALGYFEFGNHYRNQVMPSIAKLGRRYSISVISGDSAAEKQSLEKYFGAKSTLLFDQQPADKLRFIEWLQRRGRKVIMLGDGLNDAGALRQSDAGIAVTEDTNNFTPASDAILAAAELPRLSKFIRLCKANKRIVLASFVLSILYNIIGLFFAVQGNLSPLIAAILMPSSSLSILLITFGSSNVLARRFGLKG